MKRIITLFALLTMFAFGAQAQFVGANEGSNVSNQNTYSNADLYKKGQQRIKTGTIVFLGTAGTSALVTGILLISRYDPDYFIPVIIGVPIGALAATPFWISGHKMKRNAGYSSYVPIIQQDIPINDNLTFTPSIGITNYHVLSSETNSLQSNALSLGFSLNF